MIDEALERCERKGVSDFTLYEFSREHLYALTVASFTAIFNRYVKLIHFDEQLHIFMDPKFSTNDLMLLRRVFETKRYTPDAVLHDMLHTKQATFTTREQDGSNVIETHYMELSSYTGPTDYTEIRDLLESQGIHKLEDAVALVYNVEGVEESIYEDAVIDEIYVPVVGSKGMSHIDTLALSRELSADLGKLRSTIGMAERHFKKTKFKATPK